VPASRRIAIHGHFYQPPRENPWLEEVEVQDSAAPYHDWNARVTAECYAPNTAARRVDEQNRILDIVDNFEQISFDVGPTLMAWLVRHAPALYEKIVESDRASARRRGGHGNAIAQIYNHMIMPLATRRDKVTQARWGLADFRARFGREPEGCWLPETAADDESLEVLAEEGLKFTILAPHQAWRVRPLEGGAWEEVGERIDPSQPYLWRGRGGRALALFFYDAPIARAIAFEDALERSENLVNRLRGGFSDARARLQLVHCATDGESYGHHHRFGEMALAAALRRIEADGFATLTNYGAFLAAAPPTHEVEIRQRTSWSCAHGVERWRSDCGCRMRPGGHQRWRAPLREALDWLRDQVDAFYEARAPLLLKDAWQARDDYVEVVLERARLGDWLARNGRATLDAAERVEAVRLLEMQRNRLLMYTSCGWFFDDISGLEPVQNLKYAALALQYLRDLGGGSLEAELAERLAAAPSNVPGIGDGRALWARSVQPATADLRRVVAHYAITGLFAEHPDDARVYAWRIERLDEAREAYHGTAARVGHVRVRSEITGDARELMYAVLHFGVHDFTCGIRAFEDVAGYEAMKVDLLGRYVRHSMADVVRGLDDYFPRETFSLAHLFIEERRRVLGHVTRTLLLAHEQAYRRIWDDSRRLVRYLRQVDVPVPDALALAARHVLEQDLVTEVEQAATLGGVPERAFELAEEARALGVQIDLTAARPALLAAVQRALTEVDAAPTPERIARAVTLIEGAVRVGARFHRWGAQNRFFQIWRARPAARPALGGLARALGFSPRMDGAP
jgi:hypothetical protein